MNVVILGRRSSLAHYILQESRRYTYNVWKTNADVTSLKSLPADMSIDVVVNCAAQTEPISTDLRYALKQSYEHRNKRTYAVNSVAPGTIALWAAARGAYYIHVSCDSVMGNSGPYYDVQPPGPPDELAYTKFAGEVAVRALAGTYTIVRLGWLYGEAYESSYPVAAHKRSDLRVADEDKGQPIHGQEAADKIVRLLGRHREGDTVTGVLHVSSGKTPVSWFDFLRVGFPHIEPAWSKRTAKFTNARGLYPSSEEWKTGDGLDIFMAELKANKLGQRV